MNTKKEYYLKKRVSKSSVVYDIGANLDWPKVHIDCCKFLTSLGYKLKPIVENESYNTREIFAYKDDKWQS